MKAFGLQLKERGLRRTEVESGRRWLDMRLRIPMDPPNAGGSDPRWRVLEGSPGNPPREAAMEKFTETPSSTLQPPHDPPAPVKETLPAWVTDPGPAADDDSPF